jgi:hypothetical protein
MCSTLLSLISASTSVTSTISFLDLLFPFVHSIEEETDLSDYGICRHLVPSTSAFFPIPIKLQYQDRILKINVNRKTNFSQLRQKDCNCIPISRRFNISQIRKKP